MAFKTGNTFDTTSFKVGHASKVWREIRHRFPAGGVISNVSDWVATGKIPSGTPVKYDGAAKTLKAYTDAQIKGASDMATLGINAYLQEDAYITDANTIATGTAIYAGEIYEHMFDAAVVTKLKTLTTVPQIVWVV